MDYYSLRPLNSRLGLFMAVWSQVIVCEHRFSLWPIGCTPTMSVPLHLWYTVCGALLVLYAFAKSY